MPHGTLGPEDVGHRPGPGARAPSCPPTLGPFLLRGTLGRGGMGEVWLAHDPRLDRDVALKVLPTDLADDPERREQLLKEARAAAALNHPNITTIHEIGETDGRDYIALEYVQGRTVQELLAARRMELAELVNLAARLAEALEYAHAHGVVHRDIKSANVMVNEQNSPKLLDFGLAKVVHAGLFRDGADDGSSLSLERGIFGTPGAMSPEQALGRPVDQRSDIFSFGSLLYEMASGRPAFQGDTAMETMDAVINHEPEDLGSLRSDLPTELVEVVRRAMCKQPEDRYASMEELAVELKRFRRQSDTERLAGLGSRRARRRAAGTLVALAVLAVAVVAMVLRAKVAGG
ncbi:MAG: serine/threonine-protein kinase [Planctomycetota bacterium]